jgi:energy-coupling factor transporter ATP-binding protein EcfA2
MSHCDERQHDRTLRVHAAGVLIRRLARPSATALGLGRAALEWCFDAGYDSNVESGAHAQRKGATTEIKDLSVRYGRRLALENLTGSFAAGSLTAVVGPNGAGKSTLLKALAGIVRTRRGRDHGCQRPPPRCLPAAADCARSRLSDHRWRVCRARLATLRRVRQRAARDRRAGRGGAFDRFDVAAQPVAAPVNADGRIAFYASVVRADAREGIFLAAGSRIVKVATRGDAVPGGGTLSEFAKHPLPALSDSDTITFGAHLGTGTRAEGVFLANPVAGTEQVAVVGDEAPGGGRFAGFGPWPTIGANGTVAFMTALDEGPAPLGLYSTSESGVSRIAAIGDRLPDGRVLATFALNPVAMTGPNGGVTFATMGDGDAPLAKVIFTTFLYVSPVQMMPACSHTEPSPLPLLNHFGVGLFDEISGPRERLAPPVIQVRDSRIDQLRGVSPPFPSSGAVLLLVMVVVAFFMGVVDGLLWDLRWMRMTGASANASTGVSM